MNDALPALAAAMSRYAKAFARKSSIPYILDEREIDRLRRLRQAIREEEGGGGMCHVVTECLQNDFALERMSVTYLDPTGEVIFTGHVVSILEDGSILDPTADQIGEGHDVRLLRPDDPEYGRYRPEFFEDFHPGHPDVEPGLLDDWQPFWSGMLDGEREDENRSRLGEGWWLDDKSALIAYYREQAELDGVGTDFHSHWLGQRIAGLEDAISSAPAP